FNLHTIKLQGGLLKIKKGKHPKTEWGWDDIQILKKIQHEVLKLWNQTKLGQIEISRMIIQRDDQSGMLHSAVCTIDKDKIDMLFEAVDLKLGQLHLDGLRADLSLDAEKLEVSSLKIENDFNYFTYSGFIGILDASISGHVDLAGALSLLSEQFPQIQMKEVLDVQGNLKTSFLFYLSKAKKNISNGEAELTDVKFRSKSFRRIAFGFSLENQNIGIKKLNVSDQHGQLSFNNEVKIYNIEKNKIIPFEGELEVQNFNINSVLPLIQPKLNSMFANLDLVALIGIDDSDRVYLNAKPGGKVKEFVLKATSGRKILAVPRFKLGGFLLTVNKGPLLNFNYDLRF
ncbi:MAG: hypothetical protein AABY86_13820, partial [Bdellovibrionota bacterium]